MIAAGWLVAKKSPALPAAGEDELAVVRAVMLSEESAAGDMIRIVAPDTRDRGTFSLMAESHPPERGYEWQRLLRQSATRATPELREAVEDFIARNASRVSFRNGRGRMQVALVPSETLRRIFSDRLLGWEDFRHRYGDRGCFRFSRAGFSKDGRTAICFYGWQVDWDTGWGGTVVLRRTENGWVLSPSQGVGWHYNS